MTVKIGPEDIQRIATEYASLLSKGQEIDDISGEEAHTAINGWAEKEGLSYEALVFMGLQCSMAFTFGLQESLDEDPPSVAISANLRAMAFMAFAIGWECHKEYGQKRKL